LSVEPFYTQVFADDIHWGVKFLPSAAAKILRCNPKEIQTQPVFDDKILPHLTANLLNKFYDCNSFDESLKIFAEVLVNLKIAESEVDEKVTQAVKFIGETNGENKISDIAKSVNLSPRQLERRFRTSSGITPKQFSRVCRLRATAVNMLEDKMNWANRAAEMGFTDQAHLIREFSSLTKHSPKSFEKRIKKIQYHKLVK
jgi:AraC-like DNA-binding protein